MYYSLTLMAPPFKVQPPNKGHHQSSQRVHYSEVPLYTGSHRQRYIARGTFSRWGSKVTIDTHSVIIVALLGYGKACYRDGAASTGHVLSPPRPLRAGEGVEMAVATASLGKAGISIRCSSSRSAPPITL